MLFEREAPPPSPVRIEPQPGGGATYRFAGALTVATAAGIESALGDAERRSPATFDLSDIKAMDTVGAWLLYRTQQKWQADGIEVHQSGASRNHAALLKSIGRFDKPCDGPVREGSAFVRQIALIGRATVAIVQNFGQFLDFVGVVLIRSSLLAANPQKMRWTAFSRHIEHAGFNALPIVGLMSFLIGLVIVQQGAYQLRRFGAESFVVNMIGLLTLRELGVLMTAIMVAGRSGSAFTAQIGSMKITEEVDALQTMGLNPVDTLVMPRVLALLVCMPLLTIYANLTALAGGMVFGWASLDISPNAFLEGLRLAVHLDDFWAGMMKAPIFGAIIAIAGCFEGMKVAGDAESLGRHTTAAVVQSIFLVIVLDAFFAVFLTLVGI